MLLQDKQRRFVSEYVIDLCGAQAAIRAGYAKRSARQTASHLLTKHDIRALVQEKQKETEERLQISRDDVINGLLRAVDEAKDAKNPQAQIAGWREIAKMLGFYNQPALPAPQDLTEDMVKGMSDAELAVLATEGAQ